MERFRVVGASGGALFAVLVLAGLAIAPGPSSAAGRAVVEYYSTNGSRPLWQAVLIGIAMVAFVWFAGTFASWSAVGSSVMVSAAAMAGLYLVAIGCWETLAENYAGIDVNGVSTETLGDAHLLYDVGIGATHLATFMNAAFVGATAAALLARQRRRLGRIGFGLAIIQLVNAPLQIVSTTAWSDAVGALVFASLLAWVFVLSLVLIRDAGPGAAPAADDAGASATSTPRPGTVATSDPGRTA
jgi:hypothetical protein